MSAVIVAAPPSRWPTAHRSWRTPCRPASAWSGSGFLVSLPDGPQYTNHLGTVHASALLAAAEAGSGAFLVRQFGEASGYLPVVRRLEAKFRKPPGGALPPGLVVPVEEVWDRRRGRERETYTLQGYSPVLGNRPPEYLLGVLSSLPLAGLHPDDSAPWLRVGPTQGRASVEGGGR